MPTSNQYTLILQAKIDDTVINSQIAAIKNKLASMNINVGGGKIGGGGGGGTKSTPLTQAQIATQVSGLTSIADKYDKMGATVTRSFDAQGNLNKVVGKFLVDGQVVTQTNKYSQALNSVEMATKSVTNTTKSFGQTLSDNLMKVVQWAAATTLIYGTLKKLQEGVQYISDLNKSLIDAQIVTGMTAASVEQMGWQYNQLGKELGATTLQVADASLEFLRQGKTVVETQKLVRDSVMMSKLANMDTASSTEALTAIMNGFQLKVEDLTSVIDKLVQLDNSYATSVAEISSAMQRSASAASLAGVTYEELASYITIVSSTTRKSAESIGESFKTIFARMENVAAGKTVDEFGDSINNVEKVLTKYGIALRDANLQFRPMGDVLDEIGAKWNTYGATQKAQIAGAIAGVRQYTNLIAMMDNYDKVLEAQTMETKAAGLAQSRYQIYLKGVEAAQNKLTAATEHLWMDAIDSGLIVSVLNAGVKVLDFIDKLGGLQSVMIALVAIFAIFNAESIVGFIGGIMKMIPIVFGATGGLAGMAAAATAAATATALATGGLSLIIGAIALFLIGINSAKVATKDHAQVMDEYAQAVQKAKDEFDQLTSKISSESKSVEETQRLVSEYEDLLAVIGRSTEQQQRFNDLSNQLKFLLPEINGYFDGQGNFIITNTDDLQTFVDLKKQEVDLLREQRALMLTSTIIPNMEKDVHWAQATLEGLQSQQEYYTSELERAKSLLASGSMGNFRTIDMTTGAVETKSLADAVDFLESKVGALPATIETARINYQLLLNQLGQQKLELNGLNSIINANTGLLNTNASSVGLTADEIKALLDTTEQYAQVVSEMSGAVDDYISIAQKQKDETLTQDDIIKLVVAHNDYIQFIRVEAGALVIDTEALRQYNIMQLKAQQFAIGRAVATMQAAGATKAETQALNDQLAALGLLIAQASQPIDYSAGGGSTAKDPVQEMIDKIKKEQEAQKKALQDQLAAYRKIIDTRKELLKSYKEEADYRDTLADKEKALSKIQNEMTELALDNSEEAKAKRLQLADEEAKAKEDLQKTIDDRMYNLQVDALDKQLQAYTDFIDAQIAAIDTFLQDTVALMAAALARLGMGGGGSGGSGGDTVGAWVHAGPATTSGKKEWQKRLDADGTYSYREVHDGVESGFVLGPRSALKSNEEFAKLMKGELVMNPRQMTDFMTKTLPNFTKNTSSMGEGLTIDKLINIEGNATKDILPDLERVANQVLEKLNSTLYNRGYKRAVNNYAS
jgi:TP901 family phage tail tape measure protein